MADLPALAREYLDFAKTEPVGPHKDRPRASATMTSIRRAVEGFVAAVVESQLDLNALPADFIEQRWLPTQISVLKQPIQLRVRMSGVKQFTRWLADHGVAVSALTFPQINTSTPKKKDGNPMTDVSHLSDASQLDPVPSAQTQPAPFVQATVPPPAPVARPAPQQKPRNPLQVLMPGPSYKLRVRREREDGEAVYIGDYNSEQVTATGSVEAFLQRIIVPKLLTMGITGDVAMLVSPLAPGAPNSGPVEGEMRRISLTVAPAAPVQSAPMTSLPPMQSGGDPHEAVRHTISAQEQIADRVERAVEKVARAAPSQQNEEMAELRAGMASLAATMAALAEKMATMQVQQAPQGPPANETLGIIRELAPLLKGPAVATQPPTSLEGLFTVMAKAKEVFAPRDINIDVSSLEDRIEVLARQMNKKDDLVESLERLTKLKAFFQADGSVTSAPRPSGLLSALAELASTVVNNPEPMAMAAERVLNAMARVRGGEAPAQPSEPKPQLPPPLMEATKTLLAAEGPEATVAAAHAWLTLMQQIPQMRKAADRIVELVRTGQSGALAIVLQAVVGSLGFKEQMTPNRAGALAKELIAGAKNAAEAQAEDEAEDEGDEEDSPPDVTIRVGSAHGEAADEETDEGDEGGDVDEEVDEEVPAEEVSEAEVAEAIDQLAAESPAPVPAPESRRRRKGRKEQPEELAVPPPPVDDEPAPEVR